MSKRFEDGLNEDIKFFIAVLELKELVVLVDRACKPEELVKEKRKAEWSLSSSKKPREFSTQSATSTEFSSRNKVKQYLGNKAQTTSVASVGNIRSNRPECPQCSIRHPVECKAHENSCFKCDSPDHFIKDCLEMMKEEKTQNTRSGSMVRGRPQRNLGSGASGRGNPKEQAARPEGRAPARTYAIHAHE
ncbi:Gag-Pol polyprotein [Gossypium australe]|uniref:Gag-Pol polyprotein n=1 Tax=Gossypium australe TaxID=47621 RepID=A0A5B6WFX9_9ROSI|nr:Gag-Pol polyprotein [Gossypium australe]